MPKNTKRECQAKNPSTCSYHGEPPVGEIWMLPAEAETDVTSTVAPVITQSINSDLQYDGKYPSWWKSYKKQAEGNTVAPTTPQMIDVINIGGEPYAVIWEESSQAKVDKYVIRESGMNVSQVVIRPMDKAKMLAGRDEGYIKVSYVDEQSYARSFGTDMYSEYRYARRYDGKMHHDISFPPTLEEKQKMFLYLHEAVPESALGKDGKWLSKEKYAESMPATEQELDEVIQKFREPLRKALHIDHKAEGHKHPFVDYSSLPESLKNTGVGTAMYVYAAKALGRKDKILRGSGIQSEDAVRIWSRFNKKIPGRVGKISMDWFGQKKTSYMLDFRN